MEINIRKSKSEEPLIAKYLHNKATLEGIPLAGNFELTSRCNFNCKMCYVHQNMNLERELNANDWIAVADEAKKRGMLFLLLTGGEPLIRTDFIEIYTTIRKMGIMVSLNTNGSLISEEIINTFREVPPTRINISLYGASEETYERLCGVRCYETVVKNILRLKREGFSVKINCAITPHNVHDIEAVYAFGRQHEIPVQTSTYMYPPVRVNGCDYGNATDRFSAEEAAVYRLKCQEQIFTPEQLGSGIYLRENQDDCVDGIGEKMNCRAGKSSFWITWDGNMLPCGMFPETGYDTKQGRFEIAWNELRKYTDGIYLPAECKTCSFKKDCHICAASCLTETGYTNQRPAYICKMTKTLKLITYEKYGKSQT